jgi:muramoyltetrapeptide carboxypeptidase LdcA involved in peptidoglycan recycling
MPPSNVQSVKPPALRPGDTVAIVAPASNLKRTELDAGCDALRRAGYRPFYLDSILEKDIYFAGSVERRARELEEMFGAAMAQIICSESLISKRSVRIPRLSSATAISLRC